MWIAVLIANLAAAPVVDPGPAAQFKAHFEQGESLFAKADYGGAIWSFRLADELRPTPEVAYDLATCHEKLGDLEYSVFYYRLYLRRAPRAADALQVAERVGTALANAGSEGRGLLEVEASGASSATVNGKAYPALPVAAFLPPGGYEVTAEYPGGLQKRTVEVKTGRATTLNLEPLPPPLIAGTEDLSAPGATVTGAAPRGLGLHTASYGIVSLGLAAAATGTMLGAMANGDSTRLQQQRANLTLAESRSLAASANSRGLAANVLWVAGGAAALTGGVLFVVSLPEPGMKTVQAQ